MNNPDPKTLIAEATEIAVKFFKQENFKQCEVVCDQILKVDPDNISALQMSGLVKNYLKKTDDALVVYQRLLEIAPNEYESHNNISLAYSALCRYDDAIKHLFHALAIRPDHHVPWQNLGYQFRQKRDFHTAISCFERSLEIQEKTGSHDSQTWVNISGAYGELGEIQKARECLQKALEIDPNNSAAHIDMACASFLVNDWKRGWEEYEWRFIHYPHVKARSDQFDPKKQWDGRPLLTNEKIIVYCEQGIGDVFNFVRFTKDVDGEVLLLVPPETRSILGRNFPEVEILGDNQTVQYDWHVSMMSLPHILDLSCADIASKSEKYIEAGHTDLGHKDKFKIGICWAGNPKHHRDRQRSVKMSLFRRIHNMPNVKLFSLQKDTRKRVWPGCEAVDLTDGCDDFSIIDMAPHINSWEDTAAYINDMDLIISVDTSILHLAGAMGKRAWGLIPFLPDWRWGMTGESTFWYESVQLFRQEKRDDWEGVFDKVADELCLLFPKALIAH